MERKILQKIEDVLEINPRVVEKKIGHFLTSRIYKAGARGMVMGLSGGIDSAVVATLAAKYVGKTRVRVLFLPEKGVTASRDYEDVNVLARKLGFAVKRIDISSLVRDFKSQVLRGSRLATANLKARLRMCFLYYFANSLNYLVAGTGNRSELRSGYFTKYGDGGCDILPIGCLYKTQVKILAEHLKIPRRIINRVPTAGLWKGQTDEAELGLPYDALDRVFVGIDLGVPAKRLAKELGLKLSIIQKVLAREQLSKHKLSSPEIPKL